MENLGMAYGRFALLENREEHCRRARECFHEALQILTEKDYPLNYQKLLRNMAVLDRDCSGGEGAGDGA
jgi:hypothetical protein